MPGVNPLTYSFEVDGVSPEAALMQNSLMSFTDYLSESTILELGKLCETDEKRADQVISLYEMWLLDSEEAPPTLESPS